MRYARHAFTRYALRSAIDEPCVDSAAAPAPSAIL